MRLAATALISLDLIGDGAEKRTRTSTVLPLLAPEASASTNSAISARRAQNVTVDAAVVNEPGSDTTGPVDRTMRAFGPSRGG